MTQRPIVKLIIAGGRDFNDYELLKNTIGYMLSVLRTTHEIIIISGGARGADSLGEKFALEHVQEGYGLELMKADWDTHGKSAGYIRNQQMADVATHCIAFWDGKSRGTKHMIDIAVKGGIKVITVNY